LANKSCLLRSAFFGLWRRLLYLLTACSYWSLRPKSFPLISTDVNKMEDKNAAEHAPGGQTSH
jgi:hypothetical protein